MTTLRRAPAQTAVRVQVDMGAVQRTAAEVEAKVEAAQGTAPRALHHKDQQSK